MAYPENLIGLGFGFVAGIYAGYTYDENQTFTGQQLLILALLLGVGFYFAVVLS